MSTESKVLGKITIKLDKDAYLRVEEVYANSGLGRRKFTAMVNDAFVKHLYSVLDEIDDTAYDVDVPTEAVV